MLIVQKYGGTSLENDRLLLSAARRMTALARQGTKVVAVVSAQGKTTDEMIEKAVRVNRRGSAREMDAYLASGEQMSAALMAMSIGALGYAAVSLTGWQAGIHTDSCYGNARITGIDTDRIRKELEAGRIVVAAGFQGVPEAGDISTLGRGGREEQKRLFETALRELGRLEEEAALQGQRQNRLYTSLGALAGAAVAVGFL